MKRIFFSAGESSGDIHGANLIRALKDSDSSLAFEGLGGQRMAAAGMELRCDLAERAIMGFTEVIKSLGFIHRLMRDTVEHLAKDRPDCLVLIDYPGFNLQLAKRAKKLGIKIVYYISPQVWAWKKGRIHTIAHLAEKVLVILPFEEALYRDAGVDCTYVGHPLMDQLAATASATASATDVSGPDDGLAIGLLPGSRAQEIGRLLDVQLDVALGIREKHPDARFVVPCVDEERARQIRDIAGDFDVEITIGKPYELLARARFCLVASGTATLETTLFGVPMIIVYRVSPLSYWIARLLVKVDHIGLVNILAGKRIVPEFIQGDARPEKILPVALKLIDDTDERREMLHALGDVRDALGGPGASKRAAQEVLAVVKGA